MNWLLLKNSLLVSGLTTLLSVGFGFLAALWLAGMERRWRARWLALAIVALALPPFLVTNCWLHYLGFNGAWHKWVPWTAYSLKGTVWVLTLLMWPISMLAVLGAWQRLEPAHLESDPMLAGTALVRYLLFPLARDALKQAAVLTFVLALNNFAVPAILQVKVFPAEVWILFNTTFDSWSALRLSWPMIVMPLLLLIWFRRREVGWPRVEGTAGAKLFRRQLGPGWTWAAGIGTVVITFFAVGLPLIHLATTRMTWTQMPGAIAAGKLAVWNSLWFSATAATLCLALGITGWRLPIGLALWLPFLAPGVLLGIGLIAVFNRPMFSAFYQHAGIAILALGIRYLGFGWNGAGHALRTVDRDLTDAARVAGASRWQLFRLVHWPQIAPQIAALWYIIFLLCLWDVESMVLIVPPGGETLALRVFNLLHYGHNTQVNALCLALLGLALAPLLAWLVVRGILNWKAGWKRGGAALAALALLLTGCSQDNSRDKVLDDKLFSEVQIIGTRGAGVGQFNKPRSIAVDRQDAIYVVDMTGRVQKISATGQFLFGWQMPQTDIGKPKGMGRDADGNIIVVEPHYQRLNHYTTAGKLVAQWGQHGEKDGQFTMPRSVAVNSRGEVIVTEYTVVDRVQIFSAYGKKLLKVFGTSGTGNGQFNRPEGVCVDSSDRIYVADSCNHRIQVFSPDGKWLRSYGQAGNGAGDLSYPYDIKVDKAGRQYVCEFGNSRVQVFDANDKSIDIIGGAGGDPGQFANPWSIDLDSVGNLYVADSQNHRVEKFLRRKSVASAKGVGGHSNEPGNLTTDYADGHGYGEAPHPGPLPRVERGKLPRGEGSEGRPTGIFSLVQGSNALMFRGVLSLNQRLPGWTTRPRTGTVRALAGEDARATIHRLSGGEEGQGG